METINRIKIILKRGTTMDIQGLTTENNPPSTSKTLISPSPSPTNSTLASVDEVRTTTSSRTRSDSSLSAVSSPPPPAGSPTIVNSPAPGCSNPSNLTTNRIENNCPLEPANRMLVTTRPPRNLLPTRLDQPSPFHRTSTNFELLKSEQARLETFSSPPGWPVPFIKPEDCACAGFFFLRDGDKVQCAFCRGVAGEWEAGDVPLAEHKRHFPRCPFICNLPVGNIPIGPDLRLQNDPMAYGVGIDVCGPFEPSIRPYAGSSDQGQLESLNVQVRGAQPINGEKDDVTSLTIKTGSGPARKSLVTVQSRLKTFENWPASTGQTPQAMAEAGFFYIGTRDHVKCFYCDGGLRNWEECDDPWSEHSRWFATCPYVVLNKGQESSSSKASSEEEVNKEKESTSEIQDVRMNVKKALELKEEEIRILKEARQCKICMDNEVGVVFLPCGHLVSCVSCATALSNCALCRQPIKAVVRTYLS